MSSVVRAAGAKFVCPLPGPGFRPLERVLRLLTDRPVGWLEAPAGFGKTCHAARFVRDLQERDGTPYAWLSLDPGDADPVTLLQDVAASVVRSWPGLTLALNPHPKRVPAAWFTMGQHLASLLEPLGAFSLVLDDVHRLGHGESGAVALLEALVQGAGPGLRIVLVGQEAPAGLPVARWQADGRLGRVGAEALGLDAGDVRRLLGAQLGRVAPELAGRIAEATGGWPFIVRLVAQHLSGLKRAEWDADALLGQGDDLYRYLTGEILSRHTPEERRCLMVLALPDQVDPGVAETLLPGQGDGTYARLVRPPWFTALAADGVPARLHPLLRAFLRREAERRLGPGTVRDLHLRLASFLAARRQLEAAIEHALRAEAWEMALSLIDRAVPDQLAMGRVGQVRSWIAAFPPAMQAEAAPLLGARAQLAAFDGDHPLAFRLAEAARARYTAAGLMDGAVACLALCAGDLELAPTAEVTRAARAARRAGPPALRAWAALWLIRLAAAGGRGTGSRAIRSAVEAVEAALPLDPRTSRARILGDYLRYLGGSVGEIRCTAVQMVEALSAQRFDYWPALLYAGRWDELGALLDQARAVPTAVWARDFVRTWLDLPRAILLALGGEASRALELAEAAERALLPAAVQGPSWSLEMSVLRAVKTGCLLRTGALEEAERQARANQAALAVSPTMAPVGHLDLAQVLVHRGLFLEAREELAAARPLERDPGLRGLYYRTLRLALDLAEPGSEAGGGDLLDLLTEVARAGAYGFWPLYDPGPIQPALAALDDALLPRSQAAAVRRVLRLYARARAPAASALASEAPTARLETLGRLAWRRTTSSEPLLPSRRVAELLLRLLWSEGASLSRESLAEATWPETAATDQMNRMRVTLHGLRRWLEASAARAANEDPASLVADRTSVRLVGWQSLGWDVVLWRTEMRYARRSHQAGEGGALTRHARAAFDLYRGPFLPDPVWYEAFLYEREELEREHRAFAEWTAGALGLENPQLPPLLERAVHAQAAAEPLHRLWLESLVGQGRMAEARRALQECAALFEAAIGVEAPEAWVRLVQDGR